MAKKEKTIEQEIQEESFSVYQEKAEFQSKMVDIPDMPEDLETEIKAINAEPEDRPAFLVEAETSTALVPVVDQSIDIHVRTQNFQAGRLRRIMQTSYTGAEKISIDDLDQRNGVRYMHVQGATIQPVPQQIDKKTGEVTTDAFEQVLFKLTDGRVISCGGKMAEDFARQMIKDLGEYDWPEPLDIVVRMHKGKKHDYPNFQVMG